MTQKDITRFNDPFEKPNWCPGCGNFGILNALKKALHELDLDPHQVAISTGIGCSGKLSEWIRIYGIHGLHGRPVPIAQGIKLANPTLTVIAEGGDGDGYSEGMSHFIHAVRRNIDITYIVHNNGVFALTTGQAAPTQSIGFVSPSTPHGVIEPPFRPAAVAIITGATFVARGYCGNVDHLVGIYKAAIQHKGFSLVDVMQVCVTYNPSRSYKWYIDRVYPIGEDHNPTDREKALALALHDDDRIPIGIYYREERPSYEEGLPQVKDRPVVDHDISNIEMGHLMEELIPSAPRGASPEGAERIVAPQSRHVPPEQQGKEPTIEKTTE